MTYYRTWSKAAQKRREISQGQALMYRPSLKRTNDRLVLFRPSRGRVGFGNCLAADLPQFEYDRAHAYWAADLSRENYEAVLAIFEKGGLNVSRGVEDWLRGEETPVERRGLNWLKPLVLDED